MGNPPLTHEKWWMDQRKIHGVGIVELFRGRIPELNEWRVLAWDHPRTKWMIFGSNPWLNVPLNDGFMWDPFLTKFDFTD
jgi:hypothetical protein